MSVIVVKRKVSTFIKKPKTILIKILQTLSPVISDRLYLKCIFYLKVGYKLNLEAPHTFNQKLQWLKLFYRKPIMTTLVDKFEAKNYIGKIVGDKYVVKNLGVWDSFDEITFDALPSQFVLKTTHDQGGVIICKDKRSFKYDEAKKKLQPRLKFNHYFLSREWPYRNVKPRILAEELLNPINDKSFKDYKFYCFAGEPKVMYVSMGKYDGKMTFDYFDMDYNLLDIRRPNIKNSGNPAKKPINFELMIELAKRLSSGFPHIRVDFYEIDDKVYVGELTFFQGGGLMPFIPEKWDDIFGSWIDLELVKTANIDYSKDKG